MNSEQAGIIEGNESQAMAQSNQGKAFGDPTRNVGELPAMRPDNWTLLSDDEIRRIRMRSILDDPVLQKLIAEADPPLTLTLERYWSDEHNMFLYKEVTDDPA